MWLVPHINEQVFDAVLADVQETTFGCFDVDIHDPASCATYTDSEPIIDQKIYDTPHLRK